MIGLIQRVRRASVEVEGQVIGKIDSGLLVLVGVASADDEASADKLAQRIANYRVFADNAGKMNLSVSDTGGAILAVPQFTLAADTRSGRRPSFSTAAPPERGSRLFDAFCVKINSLGLTLARGEFGADMQVELINDGPVTFWLES